LSRYFQLREKVSRFDPQNQVLIRVIYLQDLAAHAAADALEVGGHVARRLLILDDQEQVGTFVQRLAEGMGYAVSATMSVAHFQQSLDASPPDEIVLDLQLGENDGIEVLRFLAGKGCRARVTLMSGTDGRTLDSARQLAVGLGLNMGQALLKPMRAAALAAALAPQEEAPAPLTQADLAAGLDNGELLVEYQPIIACATGELVCLEALARWLRPNAVRIPPDAFIPLAEADPELMDRLTFAVVARVVEDWPLLSADGFAGRIALNISVQNLQRLDFPERLLAALRHSSLLPAHVKLEVTETVAMTDPRVQMDVLLRLHLNGFELAIDDFGTGYSSLSMLRQLPYSELKIDLSFVRDMATSREALAVVKTALALAESMQLRTVAEGVEDDRTLATLTRLGATCAQGYGIGRPMGAGSLARWIESRRHAVGKPPNSAGGTGRC
jgi:EAL domain-containing protein (putative c-di-GMP-specific phosphodiesterase class I)/ActR/RegA family two-component response regulator